MTPAKLMIVDPRQGLRHLARSQLVDVLRAVNPVIANDAATLPASLHGIHARTGETIEVRLAGPTRCPAMWRIFPLSFSAPVIFTREPRIVLCRRYSCRAIPLRSVRCRRQ